MIRSRHHEDQTALWMTTGCTSVSESMPRLTVPMGVDKILNVASFGWLVVLGLKALRDSISVYIGPSPREGVRNEKR